MNNIYDNGYCLLGKVEDILNYIDKENIDDETTKDVVEELKLYNKDSIVCIDYDNAMGCRIEEFATDSIINYEEEEE